MRKKVPLQPFIFTFFYLFFSSFIHINAALTSQKENSL